LKGHPAFDAQSMEPKPNRKLLNLVVAFANRAAPHAVAHKPDILFFNSENQR
jgi:hypothetical protein